MINRINGIDFNNLSERQHFGDIYEQILNDLQSAGNAGEYYTPRAVTAFMADRIDPKPGEILLDPACGTGGFLTCSINHMRKRYVKRPEDEARMQGALHAVEKKQLPHMLCVTNMLLILWPFGPVALVYDCDDTEGIALPKDVVKFFAAGPIDDTDLGVFRTICLKRSIDWVDFDGGDASAGAIRCVRRAHGPKKRNAYRILLNKNHSPPARFATLAHELAHLFLGHLGPDKKLNVPSRYELGHRRVELEAESVAYVVCHRNGVTPRSETYLDRFVNDNTTVDDLDIYQVMRAAGQIETLLGLVAKGRFT